MIYVSDLFAVSTACLEPAIIFRWADTRRMVHGHATNSPQPHSSGFEYQVSPPWPFALARVEGSVCPILLIAVESNCLIHTFPKRISLKENAKSLTQNKNLIVQTHFQWLIQASKLRLDIKEIVKNEYGQGVIKEIQTTYDYLID